MSNYDRKSRYLEVGAGKGLVRVEVRVPPEGKERILELAAALRSQHRDGLAWTVQLDALYIEAVEKYRARCLWNIEPKKTRQGLAVIANRLRSNGDMQAWSLATRIREAITDAT